MTGAGLRATTRSGRGAHLWFISEGLIFGAWEGGERWCHTTSWQLDGRSTQVPGLLDLVPAPKVGELPEVALI